MYVWYRVAPQGQRLRKNIHTCFFSKIGKSWDFLLAGNFLGNHQKDNIPQNHSMKTFSSYPPCPQSTVSSPPGPGKVSTRCQFPRGAGGPATSQDLDYTQPGNIRVLENIFLTKYLNEIKIIQLWYHLISNNIL